ncbi:unnamed protein product [Fusarium graminearum]|uniref:Chromosome 3, complete genome n=1 Tax=Gibberella zeae (strain ATCC MYA-4620 / CBS 123657 / FGSC 9075 / NRRL 31084 / PH-1) TaxID=229533 RepID=A0A098DXN7_GIBZE|nr:unnamed protein product [Fusarium graminearum]
MVQILVSKGSTGTAEYPFLGTRTIQTETRCFVYRRALWSSGDHSTYSELSLSTRNTVAWPNGKASDYESEDSGFDPQRDHFFCLSTC